MPFGEYELSPSLIGLSLLHAAHPEAFQRLLVRASMPRYRHFTLAVCRSLGFASATTDCAPCSGSLSLRVRASSRLASPVTATRRFIMQKARRHATQDAPTACRRMGSGTVSLPSSGCFSPFPHGTRSLSVSRECLALPDGPGGFTQDYSCPALLRIPLAMRVASRTGLSPSAARRSRRLRSQHTQARRGPTTPHGHRYTVRFGLLPVRSPLLGESLLFSLPAGTKMFQFPAFAPTS